MLNPQMKGSGNFELYDRQAEQRHAEHRGEPQPTQTKRYRPPEKMVRRVGHGQAVALKRDGSRPMEGQVFTLEVANALLKEITLW